MFILPYYLCNRACVLHQESARLENFETYIHNCLKQFEYLRDILEIKNTYAELHNH